MHKLRHLSNGLCLQVWNPGFDVTPGRLIEGIITERGLVPKSKDAFQVRCVLCTLPAYACSGKLSGQENSGSSRASSLSAAWCPSPRMRSRCALCCAHCYVRKFSNSSCSPYAASAFLVA